MSHISSSSSTDSFSSLGFQNSTCPTSPTNDSIVHIDRSSSASVKNSFLALITLPERPEVIEYSRLVVPLVALGQGVYALATEEANLRFPCAGHGIFAASVAVPSIIQVTSYLKQRLTENQNKPPLASSSTNQISSTSPVTERTPLKNSSFGSLQISSGSPQIETTTTSDRFSWFDHSVEVIHYGAFVAEKATTNTWPLVNICLALVAEEKFLHNNTSSTEKTISPSDLVAFVIAGVWLTGFATGIACMHWAKKPTPPSPPQDHSATEELPV